MDHETRLTLDILAESKNTKHQRRHDAVMRFIATYGIIPAHERIVSRLPKMDLIINNLEIPNDLKLNVNHYEDLLESNPSDKTVISKLDQLYDEYYRQTNSQSILKEDVKQRKK